MKPKDKESRSSGKPSEENNSFPLLLGILSLLSFLLRVVQRCAGQTTWLANQKNSGKHRWGRPGFTILWLGQLLFCPEGTFWTRPQGRTCSLCLKTILWRSRDRRLVSLPVVDSPKDEWFPQGTKKNRSGRPRSFKDSCAPSAPSGTG